MDKQKILELTDCLKSRLIGYQTLNGFTRDFNKMFSDIKKIEIEVKSDIPKIIKPPEQQVTKEGFTAYEILNDTVFPHDSYNNNKGTFYVIKEKHIIKLINRGIDEGKPETKLDRVIRNMP